MRAEIDEASLQRGERRAELEAAKSARAQALEGLRAFDAELASRLGVEPGEPVKVSSAAGLSAVSMKNEDGKEDEIELKKVDDEWKITMGA